MKWRYLWLLQMLIAIPLFFFLFFHIGYFGFLLLTGQEEHIREIVEFNKVITRLKNFAIIYILFQICASVHGLIGIKRIAEETAFGQKFSLLISILLILVFVMLTGYLVIMRIIGI